MNHAFAHTLKTFHTASGKTGLFHSLPALAKQYPGMRLPVSMRIVLESVLRNCDGRKVTPAHVEQLANWQPKRRAHRRDPVCGVARGAAGLHRRAAAGRPGRHAQHGRAAGREPQAPSSRWCRWTWWWTTPSWWTTTGQKNSLDLNMKLEFQRNRERYEFMKWGMQAFRHLWRGAAGLWHRAPGQPGIPGARRAQDGKRGRRPSTTPTPWWAPTATPP
jgi:aconitate hydratase